MNPLAKETALREIGSCFRLSAERTFPPSAPSERHPTSRRFADGYSSYSIRLSANS